MTLDLQTAQHAATVTLNAGAALAMGATVASIWLAHATSAWALERRKRAQAAAAAGLLIALLANAVLLWLEAAAMAEVPVAQAGGAAYSMLTATHYGIAWSVGMGALIAAIGLMLVGARASLAALGVFFYTRSMVSHASANGDLSLAMLADWLHLGLVSLWIGEVIVAGLIILSVQGRMQAEDRRDRANYVQALSTSATFALAGILVTGAFGAWRNVGSMANATGNPYAQILLIKLALVACAALLGGINRFLVMPPLIGRERAGDPPPDAPARRFTLILRIEAVLLIGVLILAAVLASTSPPAAA